MSERSARDLIESALPLLPSNNYEAGRVVGVAEGTIRRWRSGDFPASVRATTRYALERMVEVSVPEPAPVPSVAGLFELLREEQRIAGVRAEAARSEARAAELRAELLKIAGRF